MSKFWSDLEGRVPLRMQICFREDSGLPLGLCAIVPICGDFELPESIAFQAVLLLSLGNPGGQFDRRQRFNLEKLTMTRDEEKSLRGVAAAVTAFERI